MTKKVCRLPEIAILLLNLRETKKTIETMRKILLLLLCVPMMAFAKEKRDDSKYLAGAVPEVNGQVLFHVRRHQLQRQWLIVYDDASKVHVQFV